MNAEAMAEMLDEIDHSFSIMRESTDPEDRADAIEYYLSSMAAVRAAVFGDDKEEA